jgi:hypothetical protein
MIIKLSLQKPKWIKLYIRVTRIYSPWQPLKHNSQAAGWRTLWHIVTEKQILQNIKNIQHDIPSNLKYKDKVIL